MCGVAGIFAYREAAAPVDANELLRMRESMRRRGPDGEGLWLSDAGRAGFAHRRLAIIDLSDAAAQPMASADGRYRIAFNGEIYNHRELKRELQAAGCRFRTESDTEVLLQLYAAQGEAMLPRLRGMYAFAVWDERERRLFLARDPFGIKPLYYADNGGTLRFASQVKALLAGGGVQATPDAAGWAGFYIWGAVPEPLTTCEQVKALPAGAWLVLAREKSPAIGFHCSLADEIGRAAVAPKADAPDGEDLRRALEESVQAHLVADVPVGMFLSAGVDSALVARLAARANPGLRSITLGFEEFRGGPRDETGAAEALAAELGTRHSTRWIGRQEFDSAREAFIDAMDQPSIDGLNTYLVSKVAAQAGMKVALSGLGGDEFFGGYPSFRQVPALARALAWSARVPALGRMFRAATAAAFRGGGAPKYAGLLEYGTSVAGAYLLRRAVYMPWELARIMGSDAAAEGLRRLGPEAAPRIFPDDVPDGRATSWAQVCALEACRYMRNMLLRDADWAGMAHGLEIRVPLVDTGVFRCVARGVAAGRPFLKQDLLKISNPRASAVPRKRGFSVPMRSWLGGGRDTGGGEGSRRWALQVAGLLGADVPAEVA